MPAQEQWRPVVGFEGYYEVSDQGRVKSLARLCPCRPGRRWRKVHERILKPIPVKTRLDGVQRLIVMLQAADRDLVKWCRIHCLVLEAFVGPRPTPQHESRHLNCNPSDNRLVNLRWGTKAENHADTLRMDHILRGERHPGAKLTDAQVIEIRRLRAAGVSGPVIAAKFGITHHLTYMIANRQVWKHV